MNNLHFSEMLLLREEIFSTLNEISARGFGLDDDCPHIDFQKIRYKRLVRLYDRLDECILDMTDSLQGKMEL